MNVAYSLVVVALAMLLAGTSSQAKPFPFVTDYGENPSFVYHANNNTIEWVESGEESDKASPLPQTLIIPPGVYSFAGHSYYLKNEGLYRFLNIGQFNEQRIVYSQDLDSFLSAIAWINSHGSADDDKGYQELYAKALKSKTFLTCGPLSKFGKQLVEEIGVKARIVQTITLDPWNGCNDGHILLEVYRPDYRKWVLYDLTCNTFFSYKYRGQPLSLIEFCPFINQFPSRYKVNFIASDTRLDVSNFVDFDTGYDYGFYAESMFATEGTLREWYRRVAQVPMIVGEDHRVYFFDADHRAQIEALGDFTYIDKTQFLKMFYLNSTGG